MMEWEEEDVRPVWDLNVSTAAGQRSIVAPTSGIPVAWTLDPQPPLTLLLRATVQTLPEEDGRVDSLTHSDFTDSSEQPR